MRMKDLFGRTLRESPAAAETTSYQLLLRAGFVRQLASGIFSMLPLGKRCIDRLTRVLVEEMQRIGGQEVSLPLVHPAELWRASGRCPWSTRQSSGARAVAGRRWGLSWGGSAIAMVATWRWR